MSDTTDKADKEDHIHNWTPHHMRQDTPAQRAANKSAAGTDAGKESESALAEAVKESKRDAPKAKRGRKK